MGARDEELARWIADLMSSVPQPIATAMIRGITEWNGGDVLGRCEVPVLLLRTGDRLGHRCASASRDQAGSGDRDHRWCWAFPPARGARAGERDDRALPRDLALIRRPSSLPRDVQNRPALRPALRDAVLSPAAPRARHRGGERDGAGRRRDLRRPHLERLQGRVRARARVPEPHRVPGDGRDSRQPRLAQRRLRPLRRPLRRAELGAQRRAVDDRRGRLERARPRTARWAAAATA